MKLQSSALIPLFVLVALAASCGGGDRSPAGDSGRAGSSGGVDLTGAGATFPYPIYSKWFSMYGAKTGIKINYQSNGSGAGVKQISEQTVDFGASDAPMTDQELAAAKGGAIMHIPTVIGVLAIVYNVPELTEPIRLTGQALADVYLKRITRWDDARLAALNPGVSLPAKDILVVYRSEGSGTTYVFTDYLSTVSPVWKSGPGRGKDVQWPVGLGARGNEGVSAQVKQTPYSIGYVELAYAKQNNLNSALLRNAAGNFVPATAGGGTAAAADIARQLPADTDYRISLIDAPGADAYPITSLTWLLVYRDPRDPTKTRKLTDFVRWALTEGEREAESLGYAPLPQPVIDRLLVRLDSMGTASGTASK